MGKRTSVIVAIALAVTLLVAGLAGCSPAAPSESAQP